MTLHKDTQKALGATVIILVIGFIGWYIVRSIPSTNSTQYIDTSIEDGSLDALVESGDAQVEEIPVDINLDANTAIRPKLDRSTVIPSRFSPEAVTILENNITKLKDQLANDPNSFQGWIDLANQYKIIDDFKGAAEIWEFLSITAEGNTISRINLGNLYHYELKDFEKSEAIFRDVISINNEIVDAYTGLHELYRYSFKKPTTLAVDVLKEGIAAIPNNIDLRMLLASYYTKLDMKTEANAVYEDVLVMARNAGNTNLVTIIEAAIQSLK